MSKYRFYITEEGTLGSLFVEKKKTEEKKEIVPGAALAALLEDDDDDWGGDIPDVSADFRKIANGGMDDEEEEIPLTADFEELPDGTLALVRWPRLRRPAVIPEEICGEKVTAIAATAFAPFHIEEKRFPELYSSPISFSIFSMRMSRYTLTETKNEGGPVSVRLPKTINHIGEHAFWHCDNLTSIEIPQGVTMLPAGVFGDCRNLREVFLPEGLEGIGYMPSLTDQMMPDIGTFAGCHELKSLVLPSTLTALGAHVFNSCGLVRLQVKQGKPGMTGEAELTGQTGITAAVTSFDHSAALRWIDSLDPATGKILYEAALPPARDKILAGDHRFGALLRIPYDFFRQPVCYFDHLAQEAFRLDFSAQMALSRLTYDQDLSIEDRRWYLDLLVRYFDRAAEFYQEKSAENACRRLFAFLEKQPGLTAADMSEILRQAGNLGLSADFIAELMEVRTKRFSTVTGFEDLDLDLDL